jgi:hypothetical protein
MQNFKKSITDELIIKNKYLHKALDQANEIIKILEEENLRLKDVLTNLASLNKQDLEQIIEAPNDRFCTV